MTAVSATEFLRQHECAICLEPLLQAVKLTPCNHVFNEKCIQMIFSSNEIKCPECRAVVLDIGADEDRRKIVRLRLQQIISDPTVDEALRQNVKESLALFPIVQNAKLPGLADHVVIPIPEVYRSNRRKCNLTRVAIVCSLSALLVLSGLALCYYSFKGAESQMQIVFLIPGICLTLGGFGVLRFAK